MRQSEPQAGTFLAPGTLVSLEVATTDQDLLEQLHVIPELPC